MQEHILSTCHAFIMCIGYGNLFTWPAIVIINWIHCRFFVILNHNKRTRDRQRGEEKINSNDNNNSKCSLECFMHQWKSHPIYGTFDVFKLIFTRAKARFSCIYKDTYIQTHKYTYTYAHMIWPTTMKNYIIFVKLFRNNNESRIWRQHFKLFTVHFIETIIIAWHLHSRPFCENLLQKYNSKL